MIFFYKKFKSKKKYFVLLGGSGGRVGRARVSQFFFLNLKIN